MPANGKVHLCSSTGVQMSSQNIHSIFGPSYLFEVLGVYRLREVLKKKKTFGGAKSIWGGGFPAESTGHVFFLLLM